MSALIEITGDDIAALGDADLRALIGLLCEADYRLAGLSTAGITWGGHEDAADGGLDVVVRGDVPPPAASFVPRNVTGFQVKKSDMPKAAILKEMCLGGILRGSIKTLLQDKGAYIIVSSAGSTTDTALERRVGAMNEAMANEIGHENFHLDFFDRGRVATWVRSHPSMVIWVREKIGKPLIGWQPYGDWAHTPGGVGGEYILDDRLRLHDGNGTTNQKLSIGNGLLKLRSALQKPGISIRLVGLSGVGKTRLVQALFDNRVGSNALAQSQAIYTDVADGPIPDPVVMANQLINDRSRAILVIDNCPPDLHRRLTQPCSGQQSTVSLLTVEYDVRDDRPEETSVFRLEPASDNVIEGLISRCEQFAHISDVDVRAIANFSGGNARIAIALANTVNKGETLSGFRDEELFKRLFWQRHDSNESLLISAQACALVYSFEGTDVSSEKSEIKFLASLVGKTDANLFRDIAELRNRDLIQSRDVWRAVLPHAIANRLAKGALESIPKDILVDGFLGSSERLIKSFTRRLSYLHDCDAAVGIVNDWLDQDGWIGKLVGNLNNFGIDVLNNIAPVSPANTLEAMERAANGSDGSAFTSKNNPHSSEFMRLLRYLAYDPELFDRSARLLCRFALSENQDGSDSDARDTLKSLFYIRLSGTHARIEARAKIIEEMIDSGDESKQELGLLLLNAALKTKLFGSFHEFSFGARSRDYGYRPKTHEEIAHWFNIVIGICSRVALSGQSISKQAKKLLADNLRGLWTTGYVFDAFEQSAREILEQGAWNDGWIAVRRIIQHDSSSFTDEDKERLYRLEKLLKPDSLLEKARAFALSGSHGAFDLEENFNTEETYSARYRRTEETTRKVGAEVAQDAETLSALLPDIVSTYNNRLFAFGIGLSEGSSDKKTLFQALHAELEKTEPEVRQIDVFLGFLSSCAKSDPPLYNSILDDLVKDDLLEWFPQIQIWTSTIDQRSVERLHETLDLGRAEIPSFSHLAFGRAHESISDDELAGLLKKILLKEGGVSVALKILEMRFSSHNQESSRYSDNLMAVARNLMATFPFYEKSEMNDHDYALGKVASICLAGPKGDHVATIMCRNLNKEISEYHISFFDYPLLLNSLAKAQPTIYLDVFLKDYPPFTYDNEQCHGPLDQISDIDILSWCEKDPSSRYALFASWMQAFRKSDKTGKYEWKPFIYMIFDKAPVLEDVLNHLANKFSPMSWTGSRANILQDRAVLYQDFYEHDKNEVAAWARSEHTKLQERIRKDRELENQENREQNERFE